MTRSQKWVVFSNNLGAGLFVPVLSLFLLSHGCTLQTLAAAMGVNSAVAASLRAQKTLFAVLLRFLQRKAPATVG